MKTIFLFAALLISSFASAQGSGSGDPGFGDPPPGCFYAPRNSKWKVKDADKNKATILVCPKGNKEVKGAYAPEELIAN